MSEEGGEVTSLLGLGVRSSSEVKMHAKVGVLKEEKVFRTYIILPLCPLLIHVQCTL